MQPKYVGEGHVHRPRLRAHCCVDVAPSKLLQRRSTTCRVPYLYTCALVCSLLFLPPSHSSGQQPIGLTQAPSPSDHAARYTDVAQALVKPGSVIFSGTPLNDVILILSQEWGVNIVAGSQIDGRVSATFRNEPLEKILDSILTANGMGYQRIGNSLVIRANTDAGIGKPSFAVEVIDIPVGHADQLEELIEALKLQMSPQGLVQPIKASGKLAISDTPERIEAVKLLLSQISGSAVPQPHYVSAPQQQMDSVGPSPIIVTELRPQFISAKDMLEPMQLLLGEGNMSLMETENILVVMGDMEAQDKARLLMHQLDRPRAQVRITGYIYDVDLAEIERLGIDWNSKSFSRAVDANGIPNTFSQFQSGLLLPNAPNDAASIASGLANTAAAVTTGGAAAAATTATTGGQYVFRTLSSNQEMVAIIQALNQTDGSRLLADPHVTVVDRHQASLGIVTEIPIQQLTQTQQGGAIGTTAFREAGIKLEVTPRIASDGTIELQVSPEFSVLAGFQEGNPIINTRRATTTVRVTHGQPLVIGGLRSKTTVETVKGIPGLMNVKFLGKLFRTHQTEVRESELLVFIMPEIVGYCGGMEREMDALDVTRSQLSGVSTAVDGPFTPPCGDKHCPQHNARTRIHSGVQDIGLVGNFDGVFINPLPPPGLQTEALYSIPSQSLPNYAPENLVAPTDTESYPEQIHTDGKYPQDGYPNRGELPQTELPPRGAAEKSRSPLPSAVQPAIPIPLTRLKQTLSIV